MRMLIVVILISFFLFSSCDKGNPSGIGSTEIIGNWILAKEKITVTEEGVTETFEDTYTLTDSYLIFVIAANIITAYINDYDETFVEEIPYNVSSGKITFFDEDMTFSISNGQLLLNGRYEEDDYIEIYEIYFNKYSGAILPDHWPSIPTIQIPDSATTISTNGTSLSGTLETGSVDWYVFSANSGKNYVVKTTCEWDSYLRLYKVDGDELTQIASNDDDPDGDLNSKIIWSCSAGGTYYFSVRELDDEYGGDYGISVTSSHSLSEQEPLFSRLRQIKTKSLEKKK